MNIEKHLSKLISKINKANRKYELFDNCSKILIALSGGKDSTILAKLLKLRNRQLKNKLYIEAIHISMYKDNNIIDDLKKTCNELSIKLNIIREIEDFEKGNCYRCSWVRRKELFLFAEKNGFSHIALGHHFDDIAETTLMNFLFHGEVSTMEPKKVFFNGKITVIRPLCLISEDNIIRYFKEISLNFSKCSCVPVRSLKREKIKEFLKSLGKSSKNCKSNLFRIGVE